MLLIFDFVAVFVIGAAVGSFVNVCVYRLPYEKSLLWPGSRCGSCFQPVRLYDNIPLVSYWILRGRCRSCGARFSIRYFFVELFTALAFVGLLYLLIFCPPLQPPFFQDRFQQMLLRFGSIPWQGWAMFIHLALLLTFLLVVSLCDLADMEIPLSVTMTGTVVGLASSTLLAWPFPNGLASVPPPPPPVLPGLLAPLPNLPLSLHRCPVFFPLPDWLPPGSWRLGLVTGLAGGMAGMAMMRLIRFLFGMSRGIEGLGIGDADLMMMAGSFVGWQVVVLALFVAVFPALLLAFFQLARGGGQALPFGPPLAFGVLATQLAWPWVGEPFAPIFFDKIVIVVIAGGGAGFLLVAGFFLRLFRGGGGEVPAS
jgi:leader peptidase (prepilin peptidase)/N-methyltransferase